VIREDWAEGRGKEGRPTAKVGENERGGKNERGDKRVFNNYEEEEEEEDGGLVGGCTLPLAWY
jgi:hypothetical protein